MPTPDNHSLWKNCHRKERVKRFHQMMFVDTEKKETISNSHVSRWYVVSLCHANSRGSLQNIEKKRFQRPLSPNMTIYNGNGVDVWKIAPNQAAQIGYQHPNQCPLQLCHVSSPAPSSSSSSSTTNKASHLNECLLVVYYQCTICCLYSTIALCQELELQTQGYIWLCRIGRVRVCNSRFPRISCFPSNRTSWDKYLLNGILRHEF